MGLGAQKRRTKLSHDPNNTTWSRSTTTYGHRILAQQGWQPDTTLGALNAAHADHYTAASSSHVRVLLREDNLGLGAKVGGNSAETFGLSLFSGVLGRLNGKGEEELEKEEGREREVEGRRRYAGMGFVSGGWLVGDRIQRGIKPAVEGEAMEGKKRKVENESDSAQVAVKKAKKTTEKVVEQPVSSDEEAGSAKAKRRDKKTKRKVEVSAESSSDDKRKRKLEKQEKRARKEERRKRKEERRSRREAKAHGKSKAKDEIPVKRPAPAPTNLGGRQAVRQRYIQQKRMASMNPQAMNEIFMVKANG